MTNTDSINPAELKKLYATSRSAKAAFDHFAQRQNNSSHTTIDRLQAALKGSGHDVSRRDLIDLFKSLEGVGCGEFVIGRRGKPSRFEWSVGLTDVGRAAAGEQVKVEAITQASQTVLSEAGDSADMVEHRYRLRADLELTLLLPLNLTASEATRIGDYVRTLPLN
jgi:hypothetical protein